ncbi:glycosyltransferase family 9 protein [Methyloradius palustris]|uniref:Glycosyltransferase n=1 Tax=Methyloradius palustris TaxID=2778876 RepID=A0A8D5JYC1_9PROT|nr:glycosyltransferase family 9 protein [Methyloradius palustris]BCM24567.1 putative glycosyltransferase [Methyloradius palustris]
MERLNPKKILAIQFKYFGDTVFITPALQAIKLHYPQAELHVLIAAEMAPLLENSTFIDKLWAMPRKRGKANIKETWPLIKSLTKECFDRVVDFGGNDRGAIFGLLVGAPIRLSYREHKQGFIKKIGYTDTVAIESLSYVYAQTHLQLLAQWGIKPKNDLKLSISNHSAAINAVSTIIPPNTILCHLATSQVKKEWPLEKWYEFYKLARNAGYSLAFSAGTNARERTLLADFKKMDANIIIIPSIPDLAQFLALISRAKLFIAGDTGPLHFAAGLGIPVIGLYAVGNSIRSVAPHYQAEEVVVGDDCACFKSAELDSKPTCGSPNPCMDGIQPQQVFEKLQARLATFA